MLAKTIRQVGRNNRQIKVPLSSLDVFSQNCITRQVGMRIFGSGHAVERHSNPGKNFRLLIIMLHQWYAVCCMCTTSPLSLTALC